MGKCSPIRGVLPRKLENKVPGTADEIRKRKTKSLGHISPEKARVSMDGGMGRFCHESKGID